MAVADRSKLEQEEEACILRFYKIVLSWDYLRLKQQANSKNSKNGGDGSGMELKEVKDTYKDVDEYLATFEPLLFEEVKAQITQENEMEWMDGAIMECNESDGFHFAEIITINVDETWESISQNDLVLVSNIKSVDGTKRPTIYAFALVEHRQSNKMRVRMHLGGEIKGVNVEEIKDCPRFFNMRPAVAKNPSQWSILKICNLSTIAREYVALRSISSLPYKDLILRAADNDHSSEERAWKISRPLMDSIQTNHNISQMEAIQAGLSRRKFVLIQGPPGTGKTQTILGLLSAILHATPARIHTKGKITEIKRGPDLNIQEKYFHWGKASPWLTDINPRDAKMPEDGDDGFFPTSGNDMKPEVVNSSRKYRVRVLVCAPSNSALDEIVMRLLHTGVRDENDRAYTPKVVRIGLKPHHSIRAVSMDYLVGQKLAGTDFQGADRQKHGGAKRDRDAVRASVIDEAAIVFSTLSFSGSNLFNKANRNFDVVIIDEAAQAVEPATLVPLANGCKQIFLVGDPVQLPATVISTVAQKFGYSMSLFKRFQRAGYPVQMLKTQYRMHPEIRSFPSKEFYADELEDGEGVEIQTKRLWHNYRCFGPFCFFDIHEGKESQPSGSGWENVDEVDFAQLLYNNLVSINPELKSSSRLAIISPYRNQVKLFTQRFQSIFGEEAEKIVDINTVDGFQGREKDVAIFSCVRANKDRGIGFVADFRRMNVGITRARSSVLVVGCASALREDEHWRSLIESAEQRNVLFKVSKPYTEFFSDESLKSMEVEHKPVVRQDIATEDMDVTMPDAGNVDEGPADDDFGNDDGGFGGDDDD